MNLFKLTLNGSAGDKNIRKKLISKAGENIKNSSAKSCWVDIIQLWNLKYPKQMFWCQLSADLVTFTKETLNGKLHCLCRDNRFWSI